jgi:hypothetical protein
LLDEDMPKESEALWCEENAESEARVLFQSNDDEAEIDEDLSSKLLAV